MGIFVGYSWNLRRTDFHRYPMPEPPAPIACCLGPAHYSWGTRCFCACHSPWRWRSQGAGERWTGSPRCLCKECLRNKAVVICVWKHNWCLSPDSLFKKKSPEMFLFYKTNPANIRYRGNRKYTIIWHLGNNKKYACLISCRALDGKIACLC